MDKTIYGQSKVMGFDPKVINLVKYIIGSHIGAIGTSLNYVFKFLSTDRYVVFASCAHDAAYFVRNSISGLTPFTDFQIIVSLEVTVGVSSHKFEVFFVCGCFCRTRVRSTRVLTISRFSFIHSFIHSVMDHFLFTSQILP